MSSLLSEYQETPAFFTAELFVYIPLGIIVGDIPSPTPICVPILLQEIVLQFASSHIKKRGEEVSLNWLK